MRGLVLAATDSYHRGNGKILLFENIEAREPVRLKPLLTDTPGTNLQLSEIITYSYDLFLRRQ